MAPWLQISEFSVNGPASPVLRHILDQRRQSRRPMPRRRLGSLQVDSHRELLAELHAELIEGIYAPYGALHEHTVLVQRQQATQGSRRSLWVQQQRARPVAVVDPVNADPRDIRRIGAGLSAVRLDFLQRIAESERLRLGETILQCEVLTLGAAPGTAQRRDEIQRLGQGPLMQHLKERVLGIGTRLTPDDGRSGEIHALTP